MGYTHYWNNDKSFSDRQWKSITAEVRKLLKASPVKISYETGAKAAPLISNESIRFNGFKEADGYETFMMHRGPNDEFCKTDRRAYDIVVCAVLIVAARYAPEILTVTSDGGMANFVEDYAGPHDKGWDDALAFVHKVLGPDFVLPKLIVSRG